MIYKNKNSYALFKNEKNLLKGLWSFKQYEELEQKEKMQKLGEIKHEYSHISLRAKVYIHEVEKKQFENWFLLNEISDIALSKVDHKALALI